MIQKQFTLLITVSVLAMTLLSVVVIAPASADPKVTITFATTGLTNYSSNIIVIDGTTTLAVSDLSWKTFSWKPGDTHTLAAYSSLRNTDFPSKNYTFSSWTNGGSLTGPSGSYIVPSQDTTITMNYVLVTHLVSFSFTGITSYSSQIIVVDGATYPLSDFGTRKFSWDNGTVHTVQAVTPIQNTQWPPQTYAFQSWTNGGSSLTGVLGTVTMPNNDVSITANYASPTHVAKFAVTGLTGYSSSIIIVDGVTIAASDLATKTWGWDAGTTHSIQAITPVVNTAYPPETFNFSSWTNGGDLTGVSGTYTMPTQDATITANYFQSSAQVKFAYAGLGTIPSGVTILTVDNQNYDFYHVASINSALDWMATSTHTVTAAPILTTGGGTKYYFNGWTNGNGLIGNTGTLTTPNSDTTVTANYGTSPPPVQAATSLSITCSPLDANRITNITGLLSSTGVGVTGETITLTYFDGVNWQPIGTNTTAANGSYIYSWTLPPNIANGQYPVKAYFAGDSSYQNSSATTGSPGNGGDLTVLPESWGSIVALLACFGGALAFFKLRLNRSAKP